MFLRALLARPGLRSFTLLPESTRRPCRAAQTKIRAQGKSEKKRIEQRTNRRKQGGHRPGAGTLRPSRRHYTYFLAQTSNTDEHRRTGTTNPGEAGEQLAAIHAEDVTQKGNKAARRTTDEQRERGGRGTPKRGACVLQRRIAQKNTRYRTACSPCQYFRVQYFRGGRTETERKKNTKRRRTGDEPAGSWNGRRVLCASSWLLFAGPEEVTTPEDTKGPCRRSQSKTKGSPPLFGYYLLKTTNGAGSLF